MIEHSFVVIEVDIKAVGVAAATISLVVHKWLGFHMQLVHCKFYLELNSSLAEFLSHSEISFPILIFLRVRFDLLCLFHRLVVLGHKSQLHWVEKKIL